MKKIGIIIGTTGLAFLASANAQAFMAEAELCQNLRSEITEEEMQDEESPFFYQNPYTVEGCDLGFDFPGFSFDFNVGLGLDWCSLAKSVTSSAREKWNDSVADVEEWTNETVDANLEDGISVNDESIVGGVGDTGEFVTDNPTGGGNYSVRYSPSYDENGYLVYE
jgi:hypothetical protein